MENSQDRFIRELKKTKGSKISDAGPVVWFFWPLFSIMSLWGHSEASMVCNVDY